MILNSKNITLNSGKSSTQTWDNIISSNRSWFSLNFAEVWKYRDLIWLFFCRDFVSTYKQTVLGPLWFVIQPIATTLIYTLIFSQVAKLPTEGLPPFIFYMSGTVLWGLFSECLIRCSNVFASNAGIFSKVYFPRLTVPISSVMSVVVTFAIQFLVFIGIMTFFALRGNDIRPNAGLFSLPLIVINMCLLGIGFGCIISALTTRYKDIQMAMGFGMQLWMYASCIFYARNSVPDSWQWVLNLNPVVPLIENFRNAFLGSGAMDYQSLILATCVSFAVFIGGVMVFHQVEKDFVDAI